MKITTSVILFCVALTPLSLTAQDSDHPIDVQTRACLDSAENQTTYGMIECTTRAYDAWDKELNKNYKLLMGVLSAEEKEKLKTAQRNWIAWRDGEIGFSGTVYGNLEGFHVAHRFC